MESDQPLRPISSRIRPPAVIMVVCGLIGFVAAMALMIEHQHQLEDPQAKLACDLSPFVACGPVMKSAAGSLFGFPNPLLGVGSFAVVITIGMAIFAGAQFKTWFWRGLEVGVLLAGIFISWLQTQSIFVIQSLCIWCMTVWAITIPLVILVTAYNLAAGHIGPPAWRRAGEIMTNYRVTFVIVWWLIVAGLIAVKFYRDFALLWFGVAL